MKWEQQELFHTNQEDDVGKMNIFNKITKLDDVGRMNVIYKITKLAKNNASTEAKDQVLLTTSWFFSESFPTRG